MGEGAGRRWWDEDMLSVFSQLLDDVKRTEPNRIRNNNKQQQIKDSISFSYRVVNRCSAKRKTKQHSEKGKSHTHVRTYVRTIYKCVLVHTAHTEKNGKSINIKFQARVHTDETLSFVYDFAIITKSSKRTNERANERAKELSLGKQETPIDK